MIFDQPIDGGIVDGVLEASQTTSCIALLLWLLGFRKLQMGIQPMIVGRAGNELRSFTGLNDTERGC